MRKGAFCFVPGGARARKLCCVRVLLLSSCGVWLVMWQAALDKYTAHKKQHQALEAREIRELFMA